MPFGFSREISFRETFCANTPLRKVIDEMKEIKEIKKMKEVTDTKEMKRMKEMTDAKIYFGSHIPLRTNVPINLHRASSRPKSAG